MNHKPELSTSEIDSGTDGNRLDLEETVYSLTSGAVQRCVIVCEVHYG